MRGRLCGGRRFECLGEVPGGIPLWIVGIFIGDAVKQRIFPTSSSRFY